MIAEFVVFLVLWIPEVQHPTFVVMRNFESAHECNSFMEDNIPVEKQEKYSCIKIDLKPPSELEVRKI